MMNEVTFEGRRLSVVVEVTPEFHAEVPWYVGETISDAMTDLAAQEGRWVDAASVKFDPPREDRWTQPATLREHLWHFVRHLRRHPGHEHVLLAFRASATTWPNEMPRMAVPPSSTRIVIPMPGGDQ